MKIDVYKMDVSINIGDLVQFKQMVCLIICDGEDKEGRIFKLLDVKDGYVIDSYESLEDIKNNKNITLYAKACDIKIANI